MAVFTYNTCSWSEVKDPKSRISRYCRATTPDGKTAAILVELKPADNTADNEPTYLVKVWGKNARTVRFDNMVIAVREWFDGGRRNGVPSR